MASRKNLQSFPRIGGPRPRRGHGRLVLEELERRQLLSTYPVTSMADDGSLGTLRWAINRANGDAVPDVIVFAIESGGVRTITLSSPLPVITSPVMIDGSAQGGYSGTPLIELDGSKLTPSDSVLTFT